MRDFITGAAAGTVATLPMTMFFEILHRRLPGEPPRPLPPREVTEALVVKLGVSRALSERDVELLSLAAHFGYGALNGALLGTIIGQVEPRHAPAAAGCGMLFGLGVWATSYFGWLPAAGMRHSPKYDVPTRTRLILAGHLVWGATAGLLLALPRRK